MRSLPTLLAALVATLSVTGPAAAASRPKLPVSVLIVIDVVEDAQQTMPAALWRRIVVDYVGARSSTAEDGTALPESDRCRAAHALYAVFASFERAPRLPGLAQEPDRAYALARFTVRNCVTGLVSPAKTVRLQSDPLSDADRGDFEPNAERTWDRSVRADLARDPLLLAAVARVVSIDGGVVLLESGGGFSISQVLRDFADGDAHTHPPIELVVLDVGGKYVRASVTGAGTPRVGDYVEAAPPAPAPAKK